VAAGGGHLREFVEGLSDRETADTEGGDRQMGNTNEEK